MAADEPFQDVSPQHTDRRPGRKLSPNVAAEMALAAVAVGDGDNEWRAVPVAGPDAQCVLIRAICPKMAGAPHTRSKPLPENHRRILHTHYHTSSAESGASSGMGGKGTFNREVLSTAWLVGEDADCSTAVDTHLM